MEQNRHVICEHWGLISYKEAWDKQQRLVEDIIQQKRARSSGEPRTATPVALANYLIFCYHPHVYTLGRNGDMGHLLLSKTDCQARGIDFFHTNRGGDITYHGPGQLVAYPILDLENFFTDVHRYMRLLETAIINTLHVFGAASFRREGLTGVWTQPPPPKKIASIGIRISRWVTMHGLALNVSPDLSYFNHIVACGIREVAVTSLAEVLTKPPTISAVEGVLKAELLSLFQMRLVA